MLFVFFMKQERFPKQIPKCIQEFLQVEG